MARKKLDIVIDAEGRDQGKMFRLTEMPAMRAEKWAAKAILALLKGGAEIPQEAAAAGIAGLASYGIGAFARVSFAEAEPLMDEMMQCVRLVPDPAKPMVEVGLYEDAVEEVATLVRLREEVLSLHLGFSLADRLSELRGSATTTSIMDSPNTGTFRAP